MIPTSFSFPKNEKLTHVKHIAQLFASKNTSMFAPILFSYTLQDREDTPCKVVISVSKKKFKKSVDRNVLKRKMREAYRLNKHLLWAKIPADKTMHLGIIYVGNTIVGFDKIEKRMQQGLSKILVDK